MLFLRGGGWWGCEVSMDSFIFFLLGGSFWNTSADGQSCLPQSLQRLLVINFRSLQSRSLEKMNLSPSLNLQKEVCACLLSSGFITLRAALVQICPEHARKCLLPRVATSVRPPSTTLPLQRLCLLLADPYFLQG